MVASEKTLKSTIGRAYVYVSVFIIGSALWELMALVLHPQRSSNYAVALILAVLVIYTLTGALFACERHFRSRVTSAATLFTIGFIGLGIGHHSIAVPYTLIIILGIATLGAQPVLHRKLDNRKKAIAYSALTVLVALVLAITYTNGVLVLDAIANSQYAAN